MKINKVIKFVLFTVIILAFAYFTIFGLNIFGRQVIKSVKDMKFGLDISGGVTIVYQAKAEEGKTITEDELNKSKAVFMKRLDAKNIYDSVVRVDASSNKIFLEIPTNKNNEGVDPLQAVEGLDKVTKIEFRDPDGAVLLSSGDVKSAAYSEQATDSTGLPNPHVVLTFTDEGAKKFTAATEKLVGKKISIYLDKELITDPVVNSRIDSNVAIITMGQDSYAAKREMAKEYAMLIDSGEMPFSLEVVSKEYIGPYIGQKALEVSIYAGITAFILVSLFMLFSYRLPGLVSVIALIAYVSIVLCIISNTGITLTLSGIAGLILSIGMAVDANVIIFERFKEELRANFGAKKAFERSNKRAMSAIIDGNTTIIIVALILYLMGVGPIKGFGIVLAIGILVSLFTAVIITKWILKQFILIADKNTFLFNVKKGVK